MSEAEAEVVEPPEEEGEQAAEGEEQPAEGEEPAEARSRRGEMVGSTAEAESGA